jgi:hypothetical protein
MVKAPIVSINYHRPQHTLRTLESLANNIGAQESELFLFCDGAKQDSDEQGVNAVRRIVRERSWCGKTHIIEHEKNLGLAQNIVSSVSTICESYGRVIVLEDDLVLSPYFLQYMNDALERYQDHPDVMHIGGYLWRLQAELPQPFFLRQPNVWGWATWQRAWQFYDSDAAAWLQRIKENGLEQKFSFSGTRPYVTALEEKLQGRNQNSWAIYWLATVFFKGLALYPHRSLVKNIGFDGSGVHHTAATSLYDTELYQDRVIHFSDRIAEDLAAEEAFCQYFRSIQPRRGSLWKRAMHRMRKQFRRFKV